MDSLYSIYIYITSLTLLIGATSTAYYLATPPVPTFVKSSLAPPL